MLYPKLFTTLQDYSREKFFSDLVAGVIVGIVAIPLAIAFAIASGVTPDKGLMTAVIAGFLVSALGGSRVQIGGPTGAFIVIVYGIVQKHGVDGLVVATFMAGIILILMGAAKLGRVIEYIPHSVVVGFTSGIALIIFSSQVKDFFGLSTGSLPAEFVEKWRVLIEHAGTVNPYALAIGAGTVLLMVFWPRQIRAKVPGSVAALVLSSAAVAMLGLPVETIGSRFGELPHGFPAPVFPNISFGMLKELAQPAFTIAMLGAIESLLSAIVADGMIGGRHRSNMELVAQGAANIASGLFGGMPATGAIARTVTNIKSGGRTPVAGIVHAFTILVLLLFFGRWVKLIPLACLAGILVMVAYHMSEWRSFRALLRTREGASVLLVTFCTTVFLDLTAAIQVGMVLSFFIFTHRMAAVTNIHLLNNEVELDNFEAKTSLNKIKVPEGVEVYEVNGPFFFGVAHKFEEATRVVAKKPKVRILRLRNVPVMDSSGLNSLKEFYRKCERNGIRLIVTGLHVQPLNEMIRTDLYDLIGEKNVFNNMHDALGRAEEFLKT